MMGLADGARLRLETPGLVFAAVAAGGVAGAASAADVRLGFAVAAGLVLIGLTAHRPVLLAVIALIGVFASQRLGTALVAGNKAGVSYSDALLCVAAFLSIPAVLRTRELHRLRLASWGVAVYLACLLPTLLLHSAERGYFEWFHRLALLGGSLVVGAWIAREGKIRLALRGLVLVACIISVATVSKALTYGWLSSAPFELNKNYVGGLLGAVAIVVFVARDDLDLPTFWWVGAAAIISAGELAAHSRGGALATSVGLFLALALQGKFHRGSVKVLAAVAAVGLAVFVYVSVRAELNRTQDAVKTSSLGFRFNVERATRSVWRTSPVDGVGLKYFNTYSYGRFAVAADNDIDNELAESGVIGLAGFIVLQGVVLTAGFRRGRKEPLAAAGFGAIAGLLAHGMVDIFWIAGNVTLPFIIMGMALARDPSDHLHQHARHVLNVDRDRGLN